MTETGKYSRKSTKCSMISMKLPRISKKNINMWPEIEAEFPAEHELEKAGSSAQDFSTEEKKEERK